MRTRTIWTQDNSLGISKRHRLAIKNAAGPRFGGESIDDDGGSSSGSCNGIEATAGTAERAGNHDSQCEDYKSIHCRPFQRLSSIEKQPDIDVAIGPVVSPDAIASRWMAGTPGAGSIQSARISASSRNAAFSGKSPWTDLRTQTRQNRLIQDDTGATARVPEVP